MTDAPPEQAWFAKADEDLEMGHDLRYGGRPFMWDDEEPRHLRARLDRDHAGYVLDNFAIVRRKDEAQFDGRYRTNELILAYMNALAAGDADDRMAV